MRADGRVLQELDCFAVVWSSRRDVAECQCGLAFVFSVPVTNCAACGRLGCNRSASQLLLSFPPSQYQYGICQTPNRYFPPPHLLLCLDAFTGARCCRATHWPMTMPEIKPGLVTTGTNTPGVHQSGAGAGAALATEEHIPTPLYCLLQAGPGGARS